MVQAHNKLSLVAGIFPVSIFRLHRWDASSQLLVVGSSSAVPQVGAVSDGQHGGYQLAQMPGWGHKVGTAGENLIISDPAAH